MKKTISFLIIISMLLSSVLLLIPVSAAAEGTPISSEAEFLVMNAGGNYYLTRDITLGSSYSSNFSGSLDGRGHKITLGGVSTAFKSIVGGSVSNLDLSANYSISGSSDMGALAAVASGNWAWRMRGECINDWLAEIIYKKTALYRRLPEKKNSNNF